MGKWRERELYSEWVGKWVSNIYIYIFFYIYIFLNLISTVTLTTHARTHFYLSNPSNLFYLSTRLTSRGTVGTVEVRGRLRMLLKKIYWVGVVVVCKFEVAGVQGNCFLGLGGEMGDGGWGMEEGGKRL